MLKKAYAVLLQIVLNAPQIIIKLKIYLFIDLKDECTNCIEGYAVTSEKICGNCNSKCKTCDTKNSSYCLSCTNSSLTAIEGSCCDNSICSSCSWNDPILCSNCSVYYCLINII